MNDSTRNNSFTQDNKRKYHLHIDIEQEYEPIQKRNKSSNLTPSSKHELRCLGYQNLDLWCDGSIYPMNPSTFTTPHFSNISSLLRFVGDGMRGLLGYCNHLVGNTQAISASHQILLQQIACLKEEQTQSIKKLDSLRETRTELEKELKRSRIKNTPLGLRQRCRNISNIETLKVGSGGLKRRIHAIRYSLMFFFLL